MNIKEKINRACNTAVRTHDIRALYFAYGMLKMAWYADRLEYRDYTAFEDMILLNMREYMEVI